MSLALQRAHGGGERKQSLRRCRRRGRSATEEMAKSSARTVVTLRRDSILSYTFCPQGDGFRYRHSLLPFQPPTTTVVSLDLFIPPLPTLHSSFSPDLIDLRRTRRISCIGSCDVAIETFPSIFAIGLFLGSQDDIFSYVFRACKVFII